MKKTLQLFCSIPLLAALVLFCLATPAFAQDSTRLDSTRLEKLENRVNQLAQQQEQMMRQLNLAVPQPDKLMPACHPGFCPQSKPTMAPLPPSACSQPGCPYAGKHFRCCRALIALILLGAAFINIMLAIWIYTDIRKRNEGSGIFIVLALLAGIPAAIIYALVRIGDRKT
jgi:hypothetical protein